MAFQRSTDSCLEQPFEDTVNPASGFKDRIRTKSYPVQAEGGTALDIPRTRAGFVAAGLGRLLQPRRSRSIAFLHLPCNWVQVMEGFYDPVHVEWLHDRWSYRLHDRDVPSRRRRATPHFAGSTSSMASSFSASWKAPTMARRSYRAVSQHRRRRWSGMVSDVARSGRRHPYDHGVPAHDHELEDAVRTGHDPCQEEQ